MDWNALLTAFALYLVLEGIIPFLNPNRFKGLLIRLSQLDDSLLRRGGAVSMLSGALLLYWVR